MWTLGTNEKVHGAMKPLWILKVSIVSFAKYTSSRLTPSCYS
jgi:hypothetical protein